MTETLIKNIERIIKVLFWLLYFLCLTLIIYITYEQYRIFFKYILEEMLELPNMDEIIAVVMGGFSIYFCVNIFTYNFS